MSGAKQSNTARMTRVTTILSIQSSVAYGHVGNSAVTFPLMRMGVNVWPVITVHFSNHTGYQTWRGPLLNAADLSEVVRGIDELGVLGGVDAVLSGYQGGEDVGAMILDAVALVKLRNPAAIYCCDPVLGDADRAASVVGDGLASATAVRHDKQTGATRYTGREELRVPPSPYEEEVSR